MVEDLFKRGFLDFAERFQVVSSALVADGRNVVGGADYSEYHGSMLVEKSTIDRKRNVGNH